MCAETHPPRGEGEGRRPKAEGSRAWRRENQISEGLGTGHEMPEVGNLLEARETRQTGEGSVAVRCGSDEEKKGGEMKER